MQSAVTKGSLWLPLVVSITFAVGGCAGTMDEATQQEMAKLRKDVDSLNLAVHRGRGESDTTLTQMERRSREQSAENTRQMAATQTRLESLSAELNRLSARVDELSQRLDSQSRSQGGSGTSSRPTPAPTPSPSGGSRSSTEPGAEESYKAAYADFTKGNYTLAVAEFREFVRQHPDSPRVDSAQYWIGESYFSMGRAAAAAGQSERSREALERSVQEFRKVFVNYPGGRQVPTALYKEALALVELKQTKVAQARLQYLVDNFPQSEEAPLARERLKSLGE
ncbi:MAG TPA: tetratricopeptide repeat protein [Candidatus Eisenbacteria bacterium]|nr:tetratricopeptide repeat protein [Candidatus Eisenbacteria bacterium]